MTWHWDVMRLLQQPEIIWHQLPPTGVSYYEHWLELQRMLKHLMVEYECDQLRAGPYAFNTCDGLPDTQLVEKMVCDPLLKTLEIHLYQKLTNTPKVRITIDQSGLLEDRA